MNFVTNHKIISVIILISIFFVLVVTLNILSVIYNGSKVAVPDIPRVETTLGVGEKLNYLVLGDSTSVSQGGDYQQGYVVSTATELAKKYQVTYKNVGVSGAVTSDVLNDQMPKVGDFKPDLVLIAIGSNDVTHLTSLESIKSDMQKTIDELKSINPEVKIVLTGSADMGTIIRFAWPLRQIAGIQTRRVNKVIVKLAQTNSVTFAYIARDTGPVFKDHHEYFAQDNFHPNNEGYAVWTSVLISAIDRTLNK